MTPEEKEKLKRDFCAEMEGLPDADKVSIFMGVKSYSPRDLAREVRSETEVGLHLLDLFAGVQEYMEHPSVPPKRNNRAPRP